MSNIMNEFNSYGDDDMLDTDKALNNILGLNLTGGAEEEPVEEVDAQAGGVYDAEEGDEEPGMDEIRKNLMVLVGGNRQ